MESRQRYYKAWYDVEDSISKTVRKVNVWLDDVFQRNHVNANAGAGGTMDSGGHADPIGYNPETGETFPYMPSSAAEVSTVSVNIDDGIVSGVGGVDCPPTRCMPVDAIPQGEYPELDYNDLFNTPNECSYSCSYNTRINSSYGGRDFGRGLEFHGGVDYGYRGLQYGYPWSWPSNGKVVGLFYGGINWRPTGFPSNSSLTFIHVSPVQGLTVGSNVYQGFQGGTVEHIMNPQGPHIHVQFGVGDNLYNPLLVFPK